MRSAIGISNAKEISSENLLLAEIQECKGPIAHAAYKESKNQFSQIGRLHVGGLLLTEIHTSPVVFKSSPNPQLSFVFPLFGSGHVQERTQSIRWAAAHQILQLSFSHPLEINLSQTHCVVITPQLTKLTKAIATREGEPAKLIEELTMSWTESHHGTFDNVDYYQQVREIFEVVELAHGNGEYLSRIGIEDLITKLLADMLLAKRECASEDARQLSTKKSERAVTLICDSIVTNIASPLTISEMEKLTGMTSRALNYAFRSRFNVSPMEWQRNYILDIARNRLSQTERCESVKTIAYNLGFTSSSSFSAAFKKRFGISPSDISARSRLMRTSPVPKGDLFQNDQ